MRNFIVPFACCFFVLFSSVADAKRSPPLHFYSPTYERLTENEWPEFRDQFERLRHLNRIADLQGGGSLGAWNYHEALARLVKISWPEEQREEIAEYLLDLSLDLLRKPGYLDGSVLPKKTKTIITAGRGGDIETDGYDGHIEVLYTLLLAHGKLARKIDKEKLTELWRFVQDDQTTTRPYLFYSLQNILADVTPGDGACGLILTWMATAQKRENEAFQWILDGRLRTAFPEDSPIPDAVIPLRFEAPVGHLDFADVEKKIPRFVVGEKISLRMTVRNDGDAPFSYDSGFLPARTMMGRQIRITFTPIPNNSGRGRPLWASFPVTAERFVTLRPGEERTHDTDVCPNWSVPLHGIWVGTGWGQLGLFRDEFDNPAPEGWTDFLRKNGYEAELADRTLFEGRFQGVCEFELIPPPPEWKDRVLTEIKSFLDGKDEIDWSRACVLVLHGYYLAPNELEEMFFKYTGGTNRNQLTLAYGGLQMFDTPRARDAVDAMDNWTPNAFDRAGAWVFGCMGLNFSYSSCGRGLDVYLEYKTVRPLFVTLLATIAAMLTILFFTIRFFLKRKRSVHSGPDNAITNF